MTQTVQLKLQEKTVIEQCILADSFTSRLKGLLGKKSITDREALILVPCDMVHTIGMRFPIDIVFVNREGLVLKIIENLQPNRIAARVSGAWAVIEMQNGMADASGIKPSLVLKWEQK
ncbi:MAG: DUF192 domain-containing protein [Syntrophomonadaceae bacterium]|nr:DUF192 domain-containing protein [Syntrophomonadaceae bacterium]